MRKNDIFGKKKDDKKRCCCCLYFDHEIYKLTWRCWTLLSSSYFCVLIVEANREQSGGPLCVSPSTLVVAALSVALIWHQNGLFSRIGTYLLLYYFSVPSLAKGLLRFIKDPVNFICITSIIAILRLRNCTSPPTTDDFNFWTAQSIVSQHNRNLTITALSKTPNVIANICNLSANNLPQKHHQNIDGNQFFCLVNTQNCPFVQICPFEPLIFILCIQFSLFAYNRITWNRWMSARFLPKGKCQFLLAYSTDKNMCMLLRDWSISNQFNLSGFATIFSEEKSGAEMIVAHEKQHHGFIAPLVLSMLYKKAVALIED